MEINEFEKLTYNISEAADVLGISRPSLYAIIHSDGFPAFRVGNRVLISRKGLAEWVEEQVQNGKEACK